MRGLSAIIKKSVNSIFHAGPNVELQRIPHSSKYTRGEIALTLTLLSIGLMLLGSAAGVMQSKNVQQFFGRAAENCSYDYTISVFLDRQNGTLLSSSQNGGRAVTATDARSPAGPETLTTGTVTRQLTSIAPYVEGDFATVTLGNLSGDLEVASTFCTDSGSATSCPTNKNQNSKTFANFTPKCGAKINYGWVVRPLTIGSGGDSTITLPPGRPTTQNTPVPTSPFRVDNSPTPRATAPAACSFKAVLELQDENGNVLTNVSGAKWSNRTAIGPDHGDFPSVGAARVTTVGLPNSNLHNTRADVTLQLPAGYALAQGMQSFFCDYGRGAFGGCTMTTATNGGLTIKDLGLICGADIKYGWRLIKTTGRGGTEPTASAQSGSGSINVRTYVVIAGERPSGNLCDANFLKTNLNKRVNDSSGKFLADIRSYEGECGIGARLIGSRTYANKMERNPGDTHIPADRRVGCGYFGLHQLPVGIYNVEFLDKELLPNADPGKPNELDVVCANAASNLNVSSGAQAEAAIVLWPKPSKACETTSGSNCSNKPGFSQTARMSKNERTGVGYETLCCKDRTEQPQSGGPGCYCNNASACAAQGGAFRSGPSYCSIAGDNLCCLGGAQPDPVQLTPPATGGTRPSGTPVGTCSGSFTAAGVKFNLSCQSRSDCAANGASTPSLGSCRLNTVCCSVPEKKDTTTGACRGTVTLKGADYELGCSSANSCEEVGGVGLSGVGGCSIRTVCCASKPKSDTLPTSCTGSTESRSFSCQNNKNCTSSGGTVVDLPGCTNSLQACCAMPKHVVTSEVTTFRVDGTVSVSNFRDLKRDNKGNPASVTYMCEYFVGSAFEAGNHRKELDTATIDLDDDGDLDFGFTKIVSKKEGEVDHYRCRVIGISNNSRKGKLSLKGNSELFGKIASSPNRDVTIDLDYETDDTADSSFLLGMSPSAAHAQKTRARNGGAIISFETIGADVDAVSLSVGMCKTGSDQCFDGGFQSFDPAGNSKVFVNVPEGLTRSTLGNAACSLSIAGQAYPCGDFSILDNEVNYLVKAGDSVTVTKQSGLADLNGDGEVNSIDFLTLTGNYELDQYDLNLDGQTNAMDVDASRTWLGTSLTN
ncbi:MAG: hypothetical protein UZ21_OP11001000090 [Microgenomates bacterium OLB22]|nr:MAG: hypothetical protein UZ21_OP11001000090 [Microgenomates bacterium OLB22]